MEKLRIITEVCISEFQLFMRRDRNVPPIGLIVSLKLSVKVQALFCTLLEIILTCYLEKAKAKICAW